VIENVGAGVEHYVEVFLLSSEVSSEYFDCTLGGAVMDRADGGGPDPGASVFEVIARHGGDHGVLQIHFVN
jgi:hypothetical protein